MVRAVKVVPLAEDGGGPGPRSFGASGSAGGSGKRGGLMGKVPSLVFDLEDLGGDGSQHPAEQPVDEASVADVAQKLAALLEPWSEPGGCRGRCGCCGASRGTWAELRPKRGGWAAGSGGSGFKPALRYCQRVPPPGPNRT